MKISSVKELAAMGKTGLKKLGVQHGMKEMMKAVTHGKAQTITNDHILLFVSGVRVVVYSHAALILATFSNRYPTVMKQKRLYFAVTDGEKSLNNISIFLTRLLGTACAACWFTSAIVDAPGVIQSQWLTVMPPYILSNALIIHASVPTDDHDTSGGVRTWRATAFALASTCMLPSFGNAHVKTILYFLGTAGYAAYIATYNSEWKRLFVDNDDEDSLAREHVRQELGRLSCERDEIEARRQMLLDELYSVGQELTLEDRPAGGEGAEAPKSEE